MLHGAKYFLLFIDDFSRKVFVYILQNKTEVTAFFAQFKALVENQTGRKIKCLRTDNGTEFCNKQLSKILMESGIQHQTSVPYSPQQNGVAERMNRSVVERARCMLFHAGLPKIFWAEAVTNAVYLINRSVCSAISGCTPEEVWTKKKPDLSNLRVFGSRVLAQIPKEKRQKWDSKAKEYIFVGYLENTKGYRLLDTDNYRIIKSRDVQFFENGFTHKSELSSKPMVVNFWNEEENLVEVEDDEWFEIEDDDLSEVVDDNCSELNVYESDVTPENVDNSILRRSNRTPKPKQMPDFHLYSVDANLMEEPTTVSEALNGPNSEMWKLAIADEYKSLMDNNTWSLVDLPNGVKPIKLTKKKKKNSFKSKLN